LEGVLVDFPVLLGTDLAKVLVDIGIMLASLMTASNGVLTDAAFMTFRLKFDLALPDLLGWWPALATAVAELEALLHRIFFATFGALVPPINCDETSGLVYLSAGVLAFVILLGVNLYDALGTAAACSIVAERIPPGRAGVIKFVATKVFSTAEQALFIILQLCMYTGSQFISSIFLLFMKWPATMMGGSNGGSSDTGTTRPWFQYLLFWTCRYRPGFWTCLCASLVSAGA
jgi:hypothetical protein